MVHWKRLSISGCVAVLSFTLVSCSIIPRDIDANEVDRHNDLSLVVAPWSRADVMWKETDTVKQLISLPQNIAYVVDRGAHDEFKMYSPAGAQVVNLGIPDDLGTANMIETEVKYVDGKAYVIVLQYDDEKNYIATGFDDSGKQLFRRVNTEGNAETYTTMHNKPDFDPHTGDDVTKERTVDGDITRQVIAVVDGVKIWGIVDRTEANAEKRSISGPDWEIEVISGYIPSAVGPYLCVQSQEVGSQWSNSRLIDPHTGEAVELSNILAGCSFDANGVTHYNAATTRSRGVLALWAEKMGMGRGKSDSIENGVSQIVVPDSGKTMPITADSRFLPYSVDEATGKAYGYYFDDEAIRSGYVLIDPNETDSLRQLRGNPRVPITISGGGIAAFPDTQFMNIGLPKIGNEVGEMIFAVKPQAE